MVVKTLGVHPATVTSYQFRPQFLPFIDSFININYFYAPSVSFGSSIEM